MDKMPGPKSDVKPATLIEQLANRLDENNTKLTEVRDTLRNFVDRMSGESLQSPPESDATTIAPGMLSDIDNRLARQLKLLDDMNEVVSAVNKIA